MSTENEIVNSFKELSDKIAENAKNDLTELKKVQIDPLKNEIKSLKEQNAKLEEKLNHEVSNTQKSIDKIELAINKGFTSIQPESKREIQEKTFKEFSVLIKDKMQIRGDSGQSADKYFDKGNFKAFITATDNSHAGLFFNGETKIGNVIEKLATFNPIVDLVRNLSTEKVLGALTYTLIDRSGTNSVNNKLVPESGVAKEGKKIKGKKISLYLGKYAGKNYVSAESYAALQAGQYDINWLQEEFAALEENDRKEVAASIMNGVLSDGNRGIKGILPSIQENATSGSYFNNYCSAAQGVFTFDDFDKFIQGFLAGYTKNPAFTVLIDKAILATLFRTVGSDGHQLTERFIYADDGLIRIKTAQGAVRVIPIDTSTDANKVSENDGFGNYTKFTDTFGAGNATITTGFTGTPANDAGKIACLGGLFSEAYTLATSSVVKVGIDDSFKDELELGEYVMGKITYRAGNVVKQQATGVAILKN